MHNQHQRIPRALKIVFIALCLLPIATAQAEERPDFVTALTQKNILSFLQEVKSISAGQRIDMDLDATGNYFINHIDDRATFKTVMQYNVPGYPTQPMNVVLNKEEYINGILQGQNVLQNYQSQIEIKDLEISNGGRRARLKTITKENGALPAPENSGSKEPIPVEGESDCEQTLVVSFNHFIQMAEASCTTSIKFSPFAGQALGSE